MLSCDHFIGFSSSNQNQMETEKKFVFFVVWSGKDVIDIKLRTSSNKWSHQKLNGMELREMREQAGGKQYKRNGEKNENFGFSLAVWDALAQTTDEIRLRMGDCYFLLPARKQNFDWKPEILCRRGGNSYTNDGPSLNEKLNEISI